MSELEFARVEQHGIHVPLLKKKFILLVTAIGPITNNRMKNVGKMLPDLMHATGFWSHFHQGIARGFKLTERNRDFKLLQRTIMCNDILGFSIFCRLDRGFEVTNY